MLRFANATNVVEINFCNTAATDEGMKVLSTLPNLAILTMDRIEVTPAALDSLRGAGTQVRRSARDKSD